MGLEHLLRACDQVLGPVYVANDRDLDRDQLDDCTVLVPSLDDLVRMKVDGTRREDWFAMHHLRAVRKREAFSWR